MTVTDAQLEAAAQILGTRGGHYIEDDLLRAVFAAAQAGAGDWQPIETAPKDGTRFLAMAEDGEIGIVSRHDPGGEAHNAKHHYECWVTDFNSSRGLPPTKWLSLDAIRALRPTETAEGEDDQRAEKDEAYRQRNHLVAALARLYPSGIRPTNIEGWSPDWHGCVYIDLPSGQISYHYHDSQAQLFSELPLYTKKWDGHDKETVHSRLAALASPLSASEPAGPSEELDEVIGKLSAAALQSSPNDDQIIADHVRDSVALLLKYRHKMRERAQPAGPSEDVARALSAALTAMTLASALPGVAREYDFSDAIETTRTTYLALLRRCSQK